MADVNQEIAELELELATVAKELARLDAKLIGSESDAQSEARLAVRAQALRQQIADLQAQENVGGGAPTDTGHYDDGHAFGWNKESDDPGYQKATDLVPDIADPEPGQEQPELAGGNRRRLVVGGLLAVAALALASIPLFLGGGDDSPSGSSSGASHDTGAKTGGAASGPGQILWGDTSRQVSLSPELPGCVSSFLWTVTITNGARYAGRQAVVLKYGPDYPGHPRFTLTVGPSGSFDVPIDVKTCSNQQTGVALVSVDGNTNVYPKPPE